MQQPLDALVADLVTRLDENDREWFEERAGIVEFDAGHSRVDAERLALLMLLQRHPGALLGVTALQMTLGGETRWALTADVERAQLQLAELGAVDVRMVDLADVLRAHPGAISFIEPLRKSDHLI
ncbi:hypothetical protein M6I34_08200 [Burkholderiaceae bacterium FT117]|uniref:hypothetical protein n=1 Tax=Zeimonas sediminis TaxID=2944268 RepID=UPI002342E971|nr:hypothetical protein [Zeimonas sediminis]MCM5570487.1 hypothetical protein [Zeimonas sediminis]